MSDDNHQKLMQSSSLHIPGMAKHRDEGDEPRNYLNGRMRGFIGIHSVHRRKILLCSPTEIHWTQPIPSHSEVTPCELPFWDIQTDGFFLPKLKVIKKIRRAAFGSTEAFEI